MSTVAKTSIEINTSQATAGLQNLNVYLKATLTGFEGLEKALGENTKALRQAKTAGGNYNATQKQINASVVQGKSAFAGLRSKILGLAGAYVSLQSAHSFLTMADDYTNISARLGVMNDGLQTTAELYNKIYLYAQRSRAGFQDTANSVAKLGIVAGHAFKNNDEIIAFVETFNKAAVVSGASHSEKSNALYQLSQAFASGRLQGDELRSVRENAPMLYKAIVDELHRQYGKGADFQKLATQGLISPDVIKRAAFRSAAEVEKAFKSMPMTFGQMMQQSSNKIRAGLAPVFQDVQKIINNPATKSAINSVVNFAIKGIYVLWGAIKKIGTVVGWVVGVFDKFKWAIAGVVGAMLLYKSVALIHIAITKSIAFFSMLAGAIKLVYAGYVGLATIAVTGLNAAQVKNLMLNIKIVAIILIIIAVLAAIVYWLDYIMGAVYWCGAAFTNAWLWVKDTFNVCWLAMQLAAEKALSGIWSFALKVADGVANAFIDAINAVSGMFNKLVGAVGNTALGKKLGLNGLKIGTIERSNLAGNSEFLKNSAARQKSLGAQLDAAIIAKPKYKDTGAAWDKGFKEGASLRDEGLGYIKDKAKGLLGLGSLDKDALKGGNISGIPSDVALDKMLGSVGDFGGFGDGDDAIKKALGDIADNTKQTADNTGKEDNYELFRDVMRQRAINRVGNSGGTVKIDMVNNNSLSSKLDIKSFLEQLAKTMEEAASTAAKGVHL